MIVLGIDPGCGHTGWALVRLTFGLATEIKDGRRLYRAGATMVQRILESGTWREDYTDCREWCAIMKKSPLDLVCIQTPLSETAATPMWRNRGQGRISPVSIARNAALSAWYAGWFEGIGKRVYRCPSQNCRTWGMKAPERIWRAAWGYTGRTSADARDAAQIALHGARGWAVRKQATGVLDALFAVVGTMGDTHGI